MQSPTQYIVRPSNDRRYNNTKEIGGIDFIVNTSEEDFRFANREAIVVTPPIYNPLNIEAGYRLMVHHNVFKFYNDMKGRRRSGKSFFKDNIFLIDDEQFFMYHDGERWHARDRYCFVEPHEVIDDTIMKPMKYEPLVGILRYGNKRMKDLGVDEGTVVCFKPDSEYEFNVEGKTMYRVFDHQITATL